MFGIGIKELVIILVIVLIIFGPAILPNLGGSIGKAIKNFRKSTDEPEKKPDDMTKAGNKS
jgi:sec-independent protein translocase protein TatA